MKIIILLSVVMLLTCSEKTEIAEQKKDDRVFVEVITLKKQKFTEEAIYFGKLEPAQTANLVCYSGGRVEKINAQEGASVKRGFSLARIDASKAYSSLETARVQQNIAKSTLEQTKKHLQNGNASQLAVDQQNLSYLNAKSAFIDAQKSYRSAFAITPINGIVTKRFIDQYQEIPQNTLTFTVSKLDTIKIEIGITETDIYQIEIGSKVTLTIPMVPGREWQGEIKYLAGAAGQEDRVFSAEAYFENKDNHLKSGTSGRVQIALITFDSAIVIPTEAIITEGVQNSVMVVDSVGKVHKKFIVTGPQSDVDTMVKSGLFVGEQVITAGFQLVREGMAVIVKRAGNDL